MNLCIECDYLEDYELYNNVIVNNVLTAKNSVKIATANLKELYVDSFAGRKKPYVSILEYFSVMTLKDIDIYILHSAKPSSHFLKSLKKYDLLNSDHFFMKQCNRLHFKTILVDDTTLYIGSANFTGSGIGAKNEQNRNFELGFLTKDRKLIAQTSSYFEAIWDGILCDGCGRKDICNYPIA